MLFDTFQLASRFCIEVIIEGFRVSIDYLGAFYFNTEKNTVNEKRFTIQV